MAKKQPKRGDARAEILDAALGVLRDEGMDKLTQTRVARAAGVSQGHLTYYFPRKTDLWLAVSRRSMEHMAGELMEYFASDGWPGATASTRQKVVALTSYLVKHRERTRMLMALMLKAHGDPELRALVVENAREVREMMARGMGPGWEAEDVDLALATLWGLSLQHLVFEGERDDAYTEELVERFFAMGGEKES